MYFVFSSAQIMFKKGTKTSDFQSLEPPSEFILPLFIKTLYAHGALLAALAVRAVCVGGGGVHPQRNNFQAFQLC